MQLNIVAERGAGRLNILLGPIFLIERSAYRSISRRTLGRAAAHSSKYFIAAGKIRMLRQTTSAEPQMRPVAER